MSHQPHHHDHNHQHQHEESERGHFVTSSMGRHGHGHDGHGHGEQHDHHHLARNHSHHGRTRERERSIASREYEPRRGHEHRPHHEGHDHDDRRYAEQRDRRHPKYDDRDEFEDECEWEPIPEEYEYETRAGKTKDTEMVRPKPKGGERKLKVYESVTENEASQEIDKMLAPGAESEEASPNSKGCCKCSDKLKARLLCRHEGVTISDELLDPNVMAWFYFKILGLKSFQLFCATCVVFGFQLSWKFDEDGVADKPSSAVKYAITYYWTVFPALGGYILFRVDIRCQKQKMIFTSFVVYSIQTILICYISFICGLAWKLILVPAVTMTLCILYLILALVPFLVQNGTPTSKGCPFHGIGTLLVLIFSSMCWFLLLGILAHFNSAIALDYSSKPWPIILFWHWFPGFAVAEAFCMLDVYELRKLFQGKHVSLKKKSWMFAAIYV